MNYYFNIVFPFLIAILLILPGARYSFGGEQKYHPLKSYTIKYRIEGNSTGEKTEYSGDWGRTLCWIENSETQLPNGGTLKINEKVITKIEGENQWIIKINLADNTGTRMKNPIFAEIYKKIKGKDPKEFSREFMTNMGAKRIGEKVVDGEKCSEWQIGEGATTCITDDVVRLESSLVLDKDDKDKVSISETATEVMRNSPDPLGICETGTASITEMTDMSEQTNKEIKVE
jgi:hypothetical protein